MQSPVPHATTHPMSTASARQPAAVTSPEIHAGPFRCTKRLSSLCVGEGVDLPESVISGLECCLECNRIYMANWRATNVARVNGYNVARSEKRRLYRIANNLPVRRRKQASTHTSTSPTPASAAAPKPGPVTRSRTAHERDTSSTVVPDARSIRPRSSVPLPPFRPRGSYNKAPRAPKPPPPPQPVRAVRVWAPAEFAAKKAHMQQQRHWYYLQKKQKALSNRPVSEPVIVAE